MHFLQAINSDLSVLIVCNKTGGTIKGDILKKNTQFIGLGNSMRSFANKGKKKISHIDFHTYN